MALEEDEEDEDEDEESDDDGLPLLDDESVFDEFDDFEEPSEPDDALVFSPEPDSLSPPPPLPFLPSLPSLPLGRRRPPGCRSCRSRCP